MGTSQSQNIREDSEEVDSLVQDNSADVYEKMSMSHGNVESVIDHFGADQEEGSVSVALAGSGGVDASNGPKLAHTFLNLTNIEQSCYISVVLHLLLRVEQSWVPELTYIDWSLFFPKEKESVLAGTARPKVNLELIKENVKDVNRDTSSPGGIGEFFNLGFSTDATWFDQTWLPSFESTDPEAYDGKSVLHVSLGNNSRVESKKSDDLFDLDINDEVMDVPEVTATTKPISMDTSVPAAPMPILLEQSSPSASPTEVFARVSKSDLETKHGEMHALPPSSLPRVQAIPELPGSTKLPTSIALFPPSRELASQLQKLLFAIFPYRHAGDERRDCARKALSKDLDALIIYHRLLELIPQANGLGSFSKSNANDALEFLLSLRSVLHYTAIVLYQVQQVMTHKQTSLKIPRYLQPLSLMSDISLSVTIPRAQYLPELATLLCKAQHTRKACHCCRRLPNSFTSSYSHSNKGSLPCCCVFVPQTPVQSYDELPCVMYTLGMLKNQLQVNYSLKKGYTLGDISRHLGEAECAIEYSVALHRSGDLIVNVKSSQFVDLSIFCSLDPQRQKVLEQEYLPEVFRSAGYSVQEDEVVDVAVKVTKSGNVNLEVLLLGVLDKFKNPRSVRLETPSVEPVVVPETIKPVSAKEDITQLRVQIHKEGLVTLDINVLAPGKSFLQKFQSSFQRSASSLKVASKSEVIESPLQPLCVSTLLQWRYPRLPQPASLHPMHHGKRCLLMKTEEESPLCELPFLSDIVLASGVLQQPRLLIVRIDSKQPGRCGGKNCACSKHHAQHSWQSWNRVTPTFTLPLQHPLLYRHAPFHSNMEYYSLDGFALYTGSGKTGHYEAVVQLDQNAWSHIDGEDVKNVPVHHSHMSSKDVYFALYTTRNKQT